MPGVFPDIQHCHCVINIFELPTLEGLEIIVGLCEGVKVGAAALAGFPSLKTLKHTASLEFHGVNVFMQDSRNESMVLRLENEYAGGKLEEAKKKLGEKCFVGMVLRIFFSFYFTNGGCRIPILARGESHCNLRRALQVHA